MAYGQSGHLAITFQNSFGASFTDSAAFVPLVSESITENINQMVENNLYGRLAESPTHEGTHEVTGDIATEAHPISVGTLLKAVLGRVATTAQGSAYVHEFLPVTSDWDGYAAVPPMTLEVYRDVGSSFIYYDMLGGALTLEIAQGQFLAASISVLGGRFTQLQKSTAGFPAGKPWTWDVVSAAYDGSAIADLRQLSLTFDNQLSPHHTLSSGKYPHRVKRGGPQTVAVEGSMLFQEQTHFQEFQSQSEKRLLISFAGETIADSYQNALSIDLPRLRFTEFSPQLTGAGQLEVSFAAKGVFDPSSGYALRITLTNTQAGY